MKNPCLRFLAAIAAVALCACPDDDPRPPPAAPPPSHELSAGGGRLTSASYQLDVQLGHGLAQRPSEGATHRLEPHTAIKP